MPSRKASIKETGEELSQADWERFDAAVAADRIERGTTGRWTVEPGRRDGVPGGSRDGTCDAEEVTHLTREAAGGDHEGSASGRP